MGPVLSYLNSQPQHFFFSRVFWLESKLPNVAHSTVPNASPVKAKPRMVLTAIINPPPSTNLFINKTCTNTSPTIPAPIPHPSA